MNSVALAVAVIARADLLVATGVGEGGEEEEGLDGWLTFIQWWGGSISPVYSPVNPRIL